MYPLYHFLMYLSPQADIVMDKMEAAVLRDSQHTVDLLREDPNSLHAQSLMYMADKDMTPTQRWIVSQVWPSGEKDIKKIGGMTAEVDVRATTPPDKQFLVQVICHCLFHKLTAP
jgi:hypothetical protein